MKGMPCWCGFERVRISNQTDHVSRNRIREEKGFECFVKQLSQNLQNQFFFIETSRRQHADLLCSWQPPLLCAL